MKTGQICAALVTHQDVDDASGLRGLLSQIPADQSIETIGGDGAYDTKQCHKVIDGRGATPSIPPREEARPWFDGIPGGAGKMDRSKALRGTAEANGRNTAATIYIRLSKHEVTV
ncbi:transposase [Caballeronia sordidicola]|uniref:transposase n=1 Tax=Caballeronia sordidicola TaxID=196367 RepID=UPI000A3CFE3B|nr:transposase [Caballeronia sordidicola]